MTSGGAAGSSNSTGGGSGSGPPPPNQNITHRTSTTATSETSDQQKETFRILKEMSDILNTGLDTKSLGLCLRLCEQGVNPVALANCIKDWRHQHKEGGD